MTSEVIDNRWTRICFKTCSLLLIVLLTRQGRAEQVDFNTEIMPVLARSGCNAGSCHGAAIGRGGFKLSLLGSNAAADYNAIVNEFEGRRVNLSDPAKSLLLRKPSEQTGHEGGERLPEGSDGYRLVQRWIVEGAQRRKDRHLTSFVVSPSQALLQRPGDVVSVSALATFNDEAPMDVTEWTIFQASDPDAVSITEGGRQFVVHRRGVHIVIARFLDRVLPIRLTVPMHDSPRPQVQAAAGPSGNAIDTFVDAQLRELRLPASPLIDDWKYIRRVTLDLAGRLPSAAEAQEFASSKQADKRSKLVRRLLDSESFGKYWALKWANELGIDSKSLQKEGAQVFQQWIARQLQADASMDETVRLMLTSTGDGFVTGPVNFLRSGANAGDLAERASRAFMGVKIQCANCHDHPLDHWKQDDYHGLAAVFAKVRRGRVVAVSDRGEVTHPVTGEPAVPRIPGERYLPQNADGRDALADWLTHPENPYFAKSMVNRVWSWLMGHGLVDPVDDLRSTNPASHPELLTWLADDFASNEFRIKHVIESICASDAYARDSATVPGNEIDSAYYSHAARRPVEAEVIADAIADVTGVPLRLNEEPLDRAIAITDNRLNIPVLDVLGRCDRENGCGGVTSGSTVSLSRSLHLINGGLINDRVRSIDGNLHRLLQQNKDNAEVLDQLFVWTLTLPNASKSDYWRGQLASIADDDESARVEFFEDVLWGLLTSQSFFTNH